MGRIQLLHLFRRPDQHEVQRHMPVVDEPEVQPSLIPASSVERNTRAIPQDVKIEVAVRDGGRCRQCGSNKELHFDHVIPWSKGRSEHRRQHPAPVRHLQQTQRGGRHPRDLAVLTLPAGLATTCGLRTAVAACCHP